MMPATRRATSGGRKGQIEVDFAGVEAGGRAIPDGLYLAEVKEVEEREGQDSGQPYLAWRFKVIEDGDAKGASVWDNTSLTPQSLWRLRTLLECLGEKIPDSKYKIILERMVGKRCKIDVVNEDYQGKQRPRVSSYAPVKATAATGNGDAPRVARAVNGDDTVAVGAKVKFKDDDGETYKGKVLSIADDVAKIDVDGDEWEVDVERLKAV